MSVSDAPRYQRILLKLSGEALAGEDRFGLNAATLEYTAKQIKSLVAAGVQVGIVAGGGNFVRGTDLKHAPVDRATSDHIGMLATVMNALALRDALMRAQVPAQVLSALPIAGLTESYDRQKAIQYLETGRVVLFCAGTGNPFFTTDSAACLRGIEINAQIVLKATQVDGVYDKDPKHHTTATKFDTLSFEQVLHSRLAVMDLTAICLAQEHNLPLRVFTMSETDTLYRIVIHGEHEGTLIDGENHDR